MVCTVGYQLRSPAELVEQLHRAQVDVVIDVRETPWSHIPGYRERALRAALAAEGIQYIHARFAGNPKQFRKTARSHAECLDMYRDHLKRHPEIAEQFASLLHDLGERDLKGCLLCYERHPEDCHRQLLLEALGLGASVEHIASEGAPRLLKA